MTEYLNDILGDYLIPKTLLKKGKICVYIEDFDMDMNFSREWARNNLWGYGTCTVLWLCMV